MHHSMLLLEIMHIESYIYILHMMYIYIHIYDSHKKK